MSQTLLVLPEAEKEVFEAASWYEERSARLASDFYDTFQSALAKIVENPYQYQVIEHGIRRAPVGKYPHGLLYVATDEEIVILSCFHGRRNPAIWRERLKP